MKPILYVANVSENDIATGNAYVESVKEYAQKEQAKVVMISAKIEEELSALNDEDRKLFLDDLGVERSGLDLLVKEAYSLLGLCTFFTAGEKECRAWTFKKGMCAPECAGIIHSDFEKGFIKAETYSYEDLITYGTPLKVKEAGKVRLEGKEYIVQDGDIMLFRFNV
jgi:GTP-binding protein ychF